MFVAACSSSSGLPVAPGGRDGGADEATRVFVGDVTGTDAKVAIVAAPTHALLYFCGGNASFTTMTHWIPTADLGGGTALTVPAPDSAGWSVQGNLNGSAIDGNVTAGDAGAFPFHAEAVLTNTIAGLYEAAGPCGKVGVIVSQPSATDAPDIQGACLGTVVMGKPSVEQVNPIRPVARMADGTIAVLVDSEQVLVTASAAPAD